MDRCDQGEDRVVLEWFIGCRLRGESSTSSRLTDNGEIAQVGCSGGGGHGGENGQLQHVLQESRRSCNSSGGHRSKSSSVHGLGSSSRHGASETMSSSLTTFLQQVTTGVVQGAPAASVTAPVVTTLLAWQARPSWVPQWQRVWQCLRVCTIQHLTVLECWMPVVLALASVEDGVGAGAGMMGGLDMVERPENGLCGCVVGECVELSVESWVDALEGCCENHEVAPF